MSNPPIAKIDFTTGNAVLYTSDGVHYTFPLVAPGTASAPSQTPPAGTGGTPSTGPLTMGNVTDGSPVTLGSGSDVLTLTLANNPSQSARGNCSVAVMLDMVDGSTVVVAAPLTVSSNAGEGGGQLFTLRGTWGALGVKVKDVRIAPANPPGMAGLWQNAVAYNYQPLAPVAGQGYDSRGGMTDGYTPGLFNSNGIAITYQAQPAASPASAGTPGVGTTPANALAPLLASASAGGTITLPSGTTMGSASLGAPAIIAGASDGSTVVDGTGSKLAQNKAVFVPTVSGAVFQGFTIKGAAVSAALGANGAGIRNAGPGIGFTARKMKFLNCQNGILTFNADILIEDSEFAFCGIGDGYTHGMYFGSGAGTVTLNRLNSHDHIGGHALKCRTGTLRVSGGTFTGTTYQPDGGASVIDLPEGGDHRLDGGTLVIPAGAANRTALGYGVENGNGAQFGKTLILSNWLFDNQTGQDVYVTGPGSNIPDAVLVLQNCTGKGAVPKISGFSSVEGGIGQA